MGRDPIRAITVVPGQADTARVEELDEPAGTGDVLVEAVAMGVCGTDREIIQGEYGWAPPGRERLVLGHESLGRVLEAPGGCGVARDDLVVGIVRRPDPVPCRCCAAGDWDMCRNGEYTERGIKALDGYGATQWRIEPEYAIPLHPDLEGVGVLMEPTTILAKAWEQIDRIAGRSCVEPGTALVTGAGPIGMLAALLAVERGLETWVVDIVDEGVKPQLVRALGAHYHCGGADDDEIPRPDVVLECTGVGRVVVDVMLKVDASGIVCLTGVSPMGRKIPVDMGHINQELVLANRLVFGSVNANRRHYEAAADSLLRADRAWLEGLITRRLRLDDFEQMLKREDDVKVVIDFEAR
jgi:threonine dehydrogenase-like Zn-dependent dehydrogenase